jgi:hypothetical protein
MVAATVAVALLMLVVVVLVLALPALLRKHSALAAVLLQIPHLLAA